MKMAYITLLLTCTLSFPCFKRFASFVRHITLKRIGRAQELEESMGEGTDNSIERYEPHNSPLKTLTSLKDAENSVVTKGEEYVPAIFTDNDREFIIFESPKPSENQVAVDQSLIDEVTGKIQKYTRLYGKKEITYMQLRCTLVDMRTYYMRTNGNVFNEQSLEECFKVIKDWSRGDKEHSLFTPEYEQRKHAQGSHLRKVASSSNLPIFSDDFLESDE